MHCIESLYGEYHIEELCAGKLQARFCRGSYNTNSNFQNNFNEEYNVMTSTRQI